MKTLIVYFSFSGNNELLAKNLTKDLEADLLQITEPKKRGMFKIMLDMLFDRFPKINEPDILWSDYQHIVLMAPIWNYMIAHPMKTFIKQNKEYLKNYSFITLCSGRDTQKEKIATQLKKITNYEPEAIIELESRTVITSEQERKGIYKITQEDLQKLKKEEAYHKFLATHVTKKETV
jgi:flavodoxin